MSAFVEAIIIGLLVVVIGVAFHWLSLKLYGDHDLNKISMFAGHLFIIGVLTHAICEISGVNKWYCTNGAACKK